MEASTPVKPLRCSAGRPPRVDRRPGALPNLVVIGAQKCGTSGLHYYLSLHPEVSMSKPKELNFFIEERNWPRGLDWYRDALRPRGPRSAARPRPTTRPIPQHQGVPERMHSVVPDAKLIYMVRDPLERIAAHWVHNYAKRREKGDAGRDPRAPEHLLRAPAPVRTCSSSASSSTTRRSRSWSSSSPSFATSGCETLRQVFEFIGVDPDFDHPRFEQERHQTSRARRARPGSR